MTSIDLEQRIRDLAERQLTIEQLLEAGSVLYEDWRKEESSVVDERKWKVAGTGTGTIRRNIGVSTTTPKFYVALSGTTNGDTMRLRSNRRWDVGPDTWGTNTIYRKLIIEWEARIGTVASAENTTFFMGLGLLTTATRASNHLIGFILTADALNSITDDGTGETVSAVGAPAVANLHKLRLEIRAGGIVDFYVDETLQATHTTNLTDQAMYLMFYQPQEAAASGASLEVGSIAAWYEGLPVPLMAAAASKESYIKALLARGMIVMQATCNANMGASTSSLVSDDLVGYGDDYFNNHFYAWIIKNASAIGVAPDDEYRLITDYASSTGTFTTNIFTANVEASDVFLVVHESLISLLVQLEAIYDIVNAMLQTSETGGTVTTDGTEQNLYINNVPAGAYKPLVLKLDTTAMVAGDTVDVKYYERVKSTGNLILQETRRFSDAQAQPLKKVAMYANRHGVRTTITRVAGAADRAYDWEIVMDA